MGLRQPFLPPEEGARLQLGAAPHRKHLLLRRRRPRVPRGEAPGRLPCLVEASRNTGVADQPTPQQGKQGKHRRQERGSGSRWAPRGARARVRRERNAPSRSLSQRRHMMEILRCGEARNGERHAETTCVHDVPTHLCNIPRAYTPPHAQPRVHASGHISSQARWRQLGM